MIPYSSTPENTITLRTPNFQDWSPLSPNSLPGFPTYTTNVYYYPLVGGAILPFTIHLYLKDVVGNPLFSQYASFRFRGNVFYNVATAIPWVNPITYQNQGYPTESGSERVPITTTGVAFNFTPLFININLLPVGVYSLVHMFRLEGVYEDGSWDLLDTYKHYLTMHISNNPVTFTPSTIHFQHLSNTPFPVKSIVVAGEFWSIIGNFYFTLSSATAGVTVEVLTQNINGVTGNYQKISGTGPAIVDITLTEYYNNGVPSGIMLNGTFNVTSGSGTLVGYINYSVTVINAATLTSSPLSLFFESVKNISQSPSQNIFFTCSAPVYTITSSIWLTTSDEMTIVNGISSPIIVVKPIANYDMAPGTYTGFVKIEATINGVISSRITVVTYLIEDFIQSPYTFGLKAFTLDSKFFKLSSSNSNAYFQVTATIKCFNFFTNEMNEITIPQKIVLYKNQSKLYFGKLVHQLMSRFPSVNEEYFQYKPALLDIVCQEINQTTNEVIRETTATNIEFVAGTGTGIANEGILDINHKANRVTKKSFAFLNLLISKGNFNLIVKRNNIVYEAFILPITNDSIITKKITFSQFNQGDVISYELSNDDIAAAKPIKKKFIIYPPGKYSNHLVWENEFLVQSAIECTGNFKIFSELEFQIQKKVVDEIENLEILDTSKTAKGTINTGWLLKTDVDTVESLMKSKRAWLVRLNDEINIRLIGKTIINEDSEKELIEYLIEFQINPKYNEETYTL